MTNDYCTISRVSNGFIVSISSPMQHTVGKQKVARNIAELADVVKEIFRDTAFIESPKSEFLPSIAIPGEKTS